MKTISNTRSENLSEEVQEIIQRMPNWIIRYGITLLVGVLLLIICLSWFIQYPDIVKAKIIITTSPSPINLVSRIDGVISLYQGDDAQVKEGQIIAKIGSTLDLSALKSLEEELTSTDQQKKFDSKFWQLETLQPFYNSYATAGEELSFFSSNNLLSEQISYISEQINSTLLLNSNLKQQLLLSSKELAHSLEKLALDSTLHEQKVITRFDYNATKVQYYNQLKAAKGTQALIINNEIQLHQLEQQRTALRAENSERASSLMLRFEAARQELLAKVIEWKKNHLIVSPATGQLAYLRFLENNTFVNANSSLFSIIPREGVIYGQSEIPLFNSGKVKIGQSVNIRLDSYPFEQFGVLNGEIESISRIPSQDIYLVKVALPKGMLTSYGESLPFSHQLKGETNIVTEKLRLFDRFFFQLRRILNSR